VSCAKSQQALDAMVCGYSQATRAAKVMVMFKAYFDDSASDEESRTLLLAGCVQKYSIWANFSVGWEAVLAESPTIKYFHMREARKLEGEFARWKAKDRDAKIKRLAEVAASYNPWTITAWISRKEFDAILKPIAPFTLRKPYLLLFYAAILKLAQWHYDDGVTLPVDYVFDEQGAIGTEAVIWYEHMKSWQKPEIAALMGSSPKFENDKMVLPLQAADMLAWHLRRHKDHPDENESKSATAPVVGLLHAEVQLTKEFLIDTAEKMKQVPNLGLVQQKPEDYTKAEFQQFIRSMPTKTKAKG
jgi:hypothetical protein